MLNVVLFFIASLGFSRSCQQDISQSAFNALQDIYDGMNGVNWSWKDASAGNKWNFSDLSNASYYLKLPCGDHWQGINCTEIDSESPSCEVISLRLSDFNLNGSLPSTINGLNGLQWLDLSQNDIESNIPVSLSYLSQLEGRCRGVAQ